MKESKKGIQTFLGSETTVEGNLVFEGTVRMDGYFTGTVESKDGAMIVGETAVINADISVHTATVSGEVRGNIHATNRIELCPTAHVFGDLSAPTVVIVAGAILHGNCTMETEDDSDSKTIKFQPKPKTLQKKSKPGSHS